MSVSLAVPPSPFKSALLLSLSEFVLTDSEGLPHHAVKQVEGEVNIVL